MRLTRKTIVALGVSGALTVMAGVSASAAVLGLPILGFGDAADESAAPPQVIHRTVYDDHYVTATTAPKPQQAPAAGTSPKAAPRPTAAPAAAPAPAPLPTFQAAASPQPASTPAPAAPDVAEPTESAPPATARPPIPAGCIEPEWDAEHGFWHCSNSESGDD